MKLVNKGRIIIVVVMLSTGLLWWFSAPMETITTQDKLSHLLAGFSLSGLALVFVLSVRSRKIENWFGGLDHVYKDHKWLAIVSVVMIFIHGRIAESVEEALAVGEVAKSTSATIASIAQFVFIVLTLVALLAKRLKYEHWRFIHRLMIIPYILGVYHTYASAKYDLLAVTPLAVWVGAIVIIGLLAGIYTVIFYQKFGFKHGGKISNIYYLNDRMIELEITLEQPMDFTSGQYVFIKVYQENLDAAPHPYTIARGMKDKIYLAIKQLGDDTTALYNEVKVGTKVRIDGPYGQFDFESGNDKQVWIAGGIGITAFISYLERNIGSKTIELFYTYRGENEAVYRNMLEGFEKKYDNFTIHFHDTSMNNRYEIKEKDITGDVSVYICGPDKMIKHYTKTIKGMKKEADIRYEEFNFAR